MPDHVAQSYNDIDGIVGQSRRTCQPAWMAHWADTYCKSKTSARSPINYEFKEGGHDSKHRSLLGGSEMETNFSILGKRSKEASKVGTPSSKVMKTEGYDCKPFPMFHREVFESKIAPISGDDSVSLVKHASSYSPMLEWAPPEAETPSRNYTEKPVKFHNFFENRSVALRSSKDDFMASTSKPVQCGGTGKAPMLSMRIGEETNPSSSLLASKEHLVNNNLQSYSAYLVDSSTTKNQVPVVYGKKFEKLHDHIVIGSSKSEKLYQTTRRVLITEETDVNLSGKFKGKMLSEFLSLSQDIGFQSRQQGVKLQLLGSSSDSEAKETTGHGKASTVNFKSESSADTASMEMSALQENRLYGMPSSTYNKDLNGGQIRRTMWNTELPDINQQLPALPASASSTGNKDTCSSRTQSLDMEHLLSNPEQAADSKSNAWPDPSSRWLKRLRVDAPDSFAHGTKSGKVGESGSHEKASNFLTSRSLGKEKMARGEPIEKVKDQTLSLSWIQRWCHKKAMSPNAGVTVRCEPEKFKETSDMFQKKKQFPSIGAMALMGKAMNGFQPCELRKMGSSLVWNNTGI